MQIIWTNCAEQMPPDDESFIIEINGTLFWAGAIGNRLKEMIDHYKDSARWTEFTEEKWEELNK